MVPMHLISPSGKHKSWRIRIKNHDGRIVKIGGYRDRSATFRLGQRIEALVNAKLNGEPPPRELAAWIEALPPKMSDKCLSLGLIDRRRIEMAKPIHEHVEEYQRAVSARKNNGEEHAKRMAHNVRVVCDNLNVEVFDDLDEHDVLVFLKEKNIAAASMRHYLISCCDFCRWMVRTKRATINPMLNTPKPSPDQDERHVRRPLTVDEFKRLMAYLDGFDFYPGQNARWSAHDRKLTYWTAVSTGFRKSELASLRRCQLYLDDEPAAIDIKARDAKNRTAASVPIPADLADALREYTANLHPASAVFWFPSSRHATPSTFRRDLEGAGINHSWETGEVVDFHALRTTAITWWLDTYELPPKRVQILARLKTLALVGRYSRKYRIESFDWLSKAPRLNEPSEATKAGS